MFVCFVVVHNRSCDDLVNIGYPSLTRKKWSQEEPWLVEQNLPYNNVSHLMLLITTYHTNICIANQNHLTTDHYECWLRTVQWLITMSADWGHFNDWSLWVLIEDSLMTDHYDCWLRTFQWLITMSADWGPFNNYKLPLWLNSNSAHLKICRDSRFSDKYDK